MKKGFLLIIFLLTSNFLVAQNKDFARSIIDSLASPSMHGRGYVNNGDSLAASLIANIFDSLGLEKINNSYFQEFEIEVNTFPGAAKVVVDKEVLQPGTDYLIDPASPEARGKFRLHFITDKDLEKPNEFLSSLKKSEKTFLVFPAANKPSKTMMDLINFLKFEPSSPVGGIIQLTENKLTWHGSTIQAARPHLIFKKSSLPEGTKKIAMNIDAEHKPSYRSRNVIGKISGKSDSTIVITAHYDHLGRMGNETYFPGANDNASGTAFLLDLAKHYSQKDSLNYTMIFIAFAAEELGLLGSKHFIENPLIQLKKIKFLLNFDLAGTGDDGVQVVNGSIYKDKFALLLSLNEEYNYLPQVKVRGEACNSDHCPFHQKGVPSFFIYTLGGITAYHDINDASKTLPLTEYDDYFQLMTKFIEELN